MAISRSQVRRPVLPREEVPAPAIGGDVIVQGMDLPQMATFMAAQRQAAKPRDGEDEQAASARAAAELMPLLLHMTVLADDGQPVYSLAEWGVHAAAHADEAATLWRKAMQLSGQAAPQEADAGPKG